MGIHKSRQIYTQTERRREGKEGREIWGGRKEGPVVTSGKVWQSHTETHTLGYISWLVPHLE